MTQVGTATATVTSEFTQADGRVAVIEQHTDVAGIVHTIEYLADAGANLAALLTTHDTNLGASLTAQEVATNIQNSITQGAAGGTPLTFVYCTVAQSLAAIRNVILNPPDKFTLIALCSYINGLSLTDTQLENLFGVAAGTPLANLKTKLANCATYYANVTGQQGQ